MRTPFSKAVLVLLTLLLVTSHASWAKEPTPKPLVIELKSSPTISFSINQPGRLILSLVPNRSTADPVNIIARLILSGEGCIAGYKGALQYNKSSRETLFSYFSTEAPWSSPAILTISQDKKTNELSITLNGETIRVTPEGRAKYLRVEDVPAPITINSVEPNNI